jgi:thioredoxin:protein disulfide reductase
MSDSPTPAGRSFPAAWLLLLLVPAGLLAGRLIAALPVPEPKGGAGSTAPGSPPSPASSGGVRWLAFDAAMEEARASGRPVLLDFSAEWCPPCQRMKRDVFENPAFARTVEAAVVPVAVVDRYRETGSNPPEVEELQRRFGIEAFPTLVVLSPATGRHVKDSGFGGAQYTAQWIESAAKQVR